MSNRRLTRTQKKEKRKRREFRGRTFSELWFMDDDSKYEEIKAAASALRMRMDEGAIRICQEAGFDHVPACQINVNGEVVVIPRVEFYGPAASQNSHS